MQPAQDPIHQLEQHLAQHLRAVFVAAVASPPGGDASWDRVLAYYGLQPLGIDERRALVAQLQVVRGPIPQEIQAVLRVIAQGAQGWLAHLRATCPADPRLANLILRVERLVDNELAKYLTAIRPPPQAADPAIDSIFANAAQTAAQVPWANMRMDASQVLVCNACGAPQEIAASFRCRYCGQHLGQRSTL